MKKNGKKIAYLFIVFVLFGLCSPSFSFVSTPMNIAQLAPNPVLLAQSVPQTTNAQNYTPSQKPGDLKCSIVPTDFDISGCLLLAIYYVFVYPTFLLATLVAIIFDWVTAVSISGSTYADNGFIRTGWGFMKNLANIVFIFGLIYIAARTILGMATSWTKKAVIYLVLGALLVNFSLFFTRVIIDVSNIIATRFYNAVNVTATNTNGQPKGLSEALVANVSPQNLINIKPSSTTNQFVEYITVFLVQIITFLLLMYVFLLMCILMLIRIGMFWLLMVGAPLAFSIGLLPMDLGPIKSISFQNWSKQVISFGFVAPVMLFFLWLASELLNISDLFPQGAYNGGIDNGFTEYFVVLLGVLVKIGFFFTILFLAQKTAKQMSGEAGAWAGKMAGAVSGAAFGALTGGYAMAARGTVMAANKVSGGRLTDMAKRGQQGNTLQRIAGNAYLSANKRLQSSSFDWRNSKGFSSRFTKFTGAMTGQDLTKFGEGSGKGGVAQKQKDREKELQDKIDNELKTKPDQKVEIVDDVEKERTAKELKKAKDEETIATKERDGIVKKLDEIKTELKKRDDAHTAAKIKTQDAKDEVTKAKEAVTTAQNGGDPDAIAKAKKELEEKQQLQKQAQKEQAEAKVAYDDYNSKNGNTSLLEIQAEKAEKKVEKATKKVGEKQEAADKAPEAKNVALSQNQAKERVDKTKKKLEKTKKDQKKIEDELKDDPEYKNALERDKKATTAYEDANRKYRTELGRKDASVDNLRKAEEEDKKYERVEKGMKDRNASVEAKKNAFNESAKKAELEKQKILDDRKIEKTKEQEEIRQLTIKQGHLTQEKKKITDDREIEKTKEQKEIEDLSKKNETLNAQVKTEKDTLESTYGEIPVDIDSESRKNDSEIASQADYRRILTELNEAKNDTSLDEQLQKKRDEINNKIKSGDLNISNDNRDLHAIQVQIDARDKDILDKETKIKDLEDKGASVELLRRLDTQKARLEKIKSNATAIESSQQSIKTKETEINTNNQLVTDKIKEVELKDKEVTTKLKDKDLEIKTNTDLSTAKFASVAINDKSATDKVVAIDTRVANDEKALSKIVEVNENQNTIDEKDMQKFLTNSTQYRAVKSRKDLVDESLVQVKKADIEAQEAKEAKEKIEKDSNLTKAKENTKKDEVAYSNAVKIQEKVTTKADDLSNDAIRRYGQHRDNLFTSIKVSATGNDDIANQFDEIANGDREKIKLT